MRGSEKCIGNIVEEEWARRRAGLRELKSGHARSRVSQALGSWYICHNHALDFDVTLDLRHLHLTFTS